MSQEDLTFRYFPNDYRWSHGLLIGLNSAPWGGAEIGEVHRIGLRLQGREGDDQAWFDEWAAEAAKVEAVGRARLAAGYKHTAAAYLLRAANYYLVGERFLTPKTEASNAIYQRAVDCFRDGVNLPGSPKIEHVQIPYEGTTLPAILVHADPAVAGSDPAPAMVYFDGFDVTKEIQYFKGVRDLVARGIACLIVDGPGNGEAIRFRDLPLIAETERYATPVYEWLAARPEIDASRIGVMAISLGGYYAPRAASLEPRYACCVAWGAQWDYEATWQSRFDKLEAKGVPSLSVAPHHLMWILGVDSKDAAMAKLKAFKLDGIVQKMTCPFLMVHGEGDEQIPLDFANKCFASVGSANKTFRLFTREEGGYHHCQIDNVSIGVHAMWDWIEDILKPGERT